MLSQKTQHKRFSFRTILIFLAVTTCSSLVTFHVAPVSADAIANSDNVLQSVNVELTGDSTITSITDTSIGITNDGEKISGEEKTRVLSPQEAGKDLPIRIMTSYHGDWGSGYDLREIAGHSGRVTVTISLQNLTVSPERVSFDSFGSSHTRSTLVGVPVTVMASAHIPSDKIQIITSAHTQENEPATNGIAGILDEDTNYVQWAALLAPPSTPVSTTFTLVLESEDLIVPTISIAAQEGYLPHTTTSSLVTNAFSSSDTDINALVAQTLSISAQLSHVLEQTGQTISETRAILTESANTIGQRTISDLQRSSQTISASTAILNTQLTALQNNIGNELSTHENTTLRQLALVTQSMKETLGDASTLPTPSAPPPTSPLPTSNQCEAISFTLDDTDIASTISSISTMLDIYAQAGENCIGTVGSSLATVLGPENTDDCSSYNAHTMTCTVLGLQTSFENAIASIPASSKNMDTAASTLTNKLNTVDTSLTTDIDSASRSINRIDLSDLRKEICSLDNEGEKTALLEKLEGQGATCSSAPSTNDGISGQIAAAQTAINEASTKATANKKTVEEAQTSLSNFTKAHNELDKAVKKLSPSDDPSATRPLDSTAQNAVNTINSRRTSITQSLENNSSLFVTMLSSMRQTSNTLNTHGHTAIENKRGEIDTINTTITEETSTAIRNALGNMETNINGAIANAEAVDTQLTADISSILAELGTGEPGGGGLIGAMNTAASTSVNADRQVAIASLSTQSLSNIQRTRTWGTNLYQAQMRASAHKQAERGGFMREIGQSTKNTTTYSFTLEGTES